jgi:hypothetical protein
MYARWIAFCVVSAAITVAAMTAGAQQDEGPILRPRVQPAKPAGATLLVTCDLACNWKLDGVAKGRVQAGGSASVKVVLGQHIVAAATLDDLDKVEKEVDIEATKQTLVRVELTPVHDARLKAEQEARDKAKPEAGATLLVLSDLACNWKLDGEAKGRIDAGGSAKSKVELGQHLVAAATEDGEDQAKLLSEVKADGQTVVNIELKPVRDARLKAEQEARDKAKQEAREKAEKEAQDNAALHQQKKEQEERELAARDEATGLVWNDPATGLMWTKTDNRKSVDWEEATAYCRNLELTEHSDWRLPTIDELKGIYDPHAETVMGSDRLSNLFFWSSTSGTKAGKFVYITFASGISNDYSGTHKMFLRALCVRSFGEGINKRAR